MSVKANIEGIDYHFGLGFLNDLLDGTGLSLDELSLQPDPVILPKMVYYARAYAEKRKGIEPEFNQYDIIDYIDERDGLQGVFLVKFKEAFLSSMNKDVPVDNKKKVTQKKE